MKFRPSCGYERIDHRTLEDATAVAWISREPADTCWDTFLQGTRLGQFQQSTIWARAKEPGGWRPVRVVLTVDEEIVGGFQILHRSCWWGGIGYVSKGPVVLAQSPKIADYATELLRKLAHAEKLRALVVQPPDLCRQMSPKLAGGGFERDMSGRVIAATWIIDLRDGFEAVEQRMNHEARRRARQAVRRGLIIREGGRQDLGTFFELMLSSCRRQRVDPNPPDLRYLLALWDAAQPAGCIRLFFADYEGKPLAGYLEIGFGKTLTHWKKGWTSAESQRNPNDLSTYDTLKKACRSGYQFFDFCAFDKRMGISMLKKEPLSAEQLHSRYMCFIRFGGGLRLLPESRVYFPSPIARFAYRLWFNGRILQARKDDEADRALVNNRDGLEFAEAWKHLG